MAVINLPRRMTVPKWIDLMYNPKYQSLNEQGVPSRGGSSSSEQTASSSFDDFGVIDDSVDSLWAHRKKRLAM